jgi:RHS repeat-associated protein
MTLSGAFVRDVTIEVKLGVCSGGTGTITTPFGFQGAYTDPSGLVYLVNRYYDPSTDQFLSVDPDVAETGQPYAFTGDDPLNETDPLGLKGCGANIFCYLGSAYSKTNHGARRVAKAVEHSSVEHDLVDIPQDASYLSYWATYVTIEKAKELGSHVPGGTVAAEIVTAPLVPIEAAGLGGQSAGSLAKGESIYLEDIPGQPLFGHQTGGVALSQDLGNLLGSSVPTHMNFPGFNYFNHQTDFEW